MNNLVLLCPFHHRAVHESGWRVEMHERGAPRFFNPLGARVPAVPAAPDIGALVPGGDSPTHRKPAPALSKPASLPNPSSAAPKRSPAFPKPAPALQKSPAALHGASPAAPSVSSEPLADPSASPDHDFGLARRHGRDGIDAWTGTTL